MDEILKDIQARVTCRVKEGFDDEESIVEGVTEGVEDEHGRDDLRPVVEEVTAERMATHQRDQAQWASPTDCDRLDEAFADLERRGIVARQNFTCCSTCGHSEIWGEIEEAGGAKHVKGYAFYHMQDTESAAEYGSLYLAYGSAEETEEQTAEVAKTILYCLKQAGLQPEWNGRTNTRIHLTLDWKRRR